MSSISLLKDQLLSQGLTHYVVLDATGGVVDYSGDFACREKRRLAHTILQQSALLLSSSSSSPCASATTTSSDGDTRHEDTLRRVTMTLPGVEYTATTLVVDGGAVYGVVVKRTHNNKNNNGNNDDNNSGSDGSTALLRNMQADAVGVGRTIIGRGEVPPPATVTATMAPTPATATAATAAADAGESAYIRIDSPRAAVSRLQAYIDVAANGDAWLSDGNSTNGTFLAVHAGSGVRLRPGCCYQLSAGCRIRFGDVERHFVGATTTTTGASAAAATAMPPSTSVSPAAAAVAATTTTTAAATTNTATTEYNDNNDNTDDDDDAGRKATNVMAASTLPQRHDTHTHTPHRSVHVHDVIHVDSASSSSSSSSSITSRKRMRSSSLTASPSPPAAVAASTATVTAADGGNAHTASVSSSPPAQQQEHQHQQRRPPRCALFLACLSGLGAAQRDAVRRLVRRRGGRVVDDVVDADVLLVATPVARTPKVLIAIGRGIPVVSTAYVADDNRHNIFDSNNDNNNVANYVVSLTHDHRTYSSTSLRTTIFRRDRRPLLHGALYNTAALTRNVRRVAEEVIVGCGGAVAHRSRDPGTRLADGDVQALYDAIVRGCRPQTSS